MARIIMSYEDTKWLKEYDNVPERKAIAIAELLAGDTNISYSSFHKVYEEILKQQGRAEAIDDFYKLLTRNFMKMIATHTIGEILDKSYEQIKEIEENDRL